MKILIIEDEPPAARRLQKVLNTLLENLNGLGKIPSEIEWVGEAEQALEAVARNPDLIFLDLNLGGFHSLEWLRESRLPSDRVIIVSADTHYCDEAFALGVFAYVFKPIDPDLLAGHIERFIRARNWIA